MRAYRGGLLLLLSVASIGALTPRAVAAACRGDCDGNGRVVINELVTGVNIVLGRALPEACSTMDADMSGAVGVDELVAAVNDARQGCLEGIEAVESVAGATLALVRPASSLSSLLLGLVSAVNQAIGESGAGNAAGAIPCSAGGSSDNSCAPRGTDKIAVTFTWSECTFRRSSGSLVLDGSVTLVSGGACPSFIIPIAIQVEGHIVATERDDNGSDTRVGTVELDGTISRVIFGARPCSVKGGIAAFTGTVETAQPGLGTTMLSLHETAVDLQFDDFGQNCSPETSTLIFDGSVDIVDRFAAPALEVGGTLTDFSVTKRTRAGSGEQTSLAGTFASDCFNGEVSVETLDPFSGDQCPTDGRLRVDTATGRGRIDFRADSGVDLDNGDEGVVDDAFSTCIDAPLRSCIP